MPRPNRDKQIIQALRRNPEPKLVAADLNISPRTVYRAIERTGVDLDLLRQVHELPADQERQAYMFLVQNGISKSEVARRFGVSIQYVSQVA